ncbi:Gag-asp_proteas domain-containing protein [Quillaja saponaria]|uniref:Gag-asp_proteas domain-containing protein n=1 Tax=Quillaja saponaria TaxID=32244 RepID=A0AAD7M6B6_QUISA|nr:Gag-asp_proteas domain-containing protein [Quillaja saponaria]
MATIVEDVIAKAKMIEIEPKAGITLKHHPTNKEKVNGNECEAIDAATEKDKVISENEMKVGEGLNNGKVQEDKVVDGNEVPKDQPKKEVAVKVEPNGISFPVILDDGKQLNCVGLRKKTILGMVSQRKLVQCMSHMAACLVMGTLWGMANQQKFDWIDSQLGELARVSDSMIDIRASLKEFDIPGLIERVTTLEGLVSRVRALERNKNVQGTGDNAAELEERVSSIDQFQAQLEGAVHTMRGEILEDMAIMKDELGELNTKVNITMRARVQDLSTAQAAAERLTDYALESSASKKPQQSSSGGNGGQFGKPGKNKSGGGDQRKPSYPSNSPQSSRGSVSTSKPRTISCFLCNGQHRVMECSQKTALNALQASVCKAPQSHADEDEDEDESDEDQPRIGALRFIGALKKHAESSKKSGDKGLMFVKGHLGGKPATSVMLGTGATHNFVSEAEAKKLGLKLEKDSGRIKPVNSKSLPIAGQAKQVSV